ncbi:CinA family protein [Sulfurospirillum sp. 1612]|uniref:CinA family protein n=1 Tax=Sulfurospirillum sp. 1612 TaxID=3094835 RepID=UPI002F935EFD
MSSSLIIVGESILYNPSFMDYIMRTLKQHVSFFNSIKLIDKNDSNFFIELEEMIHKYEQTIVIAQEDSFNFVNKIFSTLDNDNLVLKDNMLIPSKTLVYEAHSYIMKKDEHLINVMCVNENETLPQVLINTAFTSRTFTIVDIDMDSINVLLEPLCETYEIKINATAIIAGWTCVNAKANKYGNLENFLKAVKSLFAHKYIETDNVIQHITERLEKNEKKITAVESCTGGLISSMLTKQAGVSSVFDGGLVTYANTIKESWLGVSAQTLEKYGAVSEACVQEMLDGALQASHADYALATSGIAGPSGGSAQKPVGTVFVGAKIAGGLTRIERLLLHGDRIYIQKQSAYHAFKLLLQIEKTLF